MPQGFHPQFKFNVRVATERDVPALRELIETSVRTLQRTEYSREQIEGSLQGTQGVDTRLIADGTYYVVEVDGPAGEPIVVGCGGWSKRKTLFGSDQRADREDSFLDPVADAAKIRAFFVHPEWVRHGIASKILDCCEKAAREAGFRRLEMGATLTGVPLYAARGYREVERIEVPLPNGAALPVVRMAKVIG
jgi:N-acetylglutamate synthase-like GNAT family acetyltransferase